MKENKEKQCPDYTEAAPLYRGPAAANPLKDRPLGLNKPTRKQTLQEWHRALRHLVMLKKDRDVLLLKLLELDATIDYQIRTLSHDALRVSQSNRFRISSDDATAYWVESSDTLEIPEEFTLNVAKERSVKVAPRLTIRSHKPVELFTMIQDEIEDLEEEG